MSAQMETFQALNHTGLREIVVSIDDSRGILVRQSEVGPDCPGALDEELDSFVPHELL